MSLYQTLKVYEALDSSFVSGDSVYDLFKEYKEVDYSYKTVEEGKGKADCLKIVIRGNSGELSGGKSPTIGVIGRLGGVGARPSRIGLVSDGDGAIAAVTTALKLATMQKKGDYLDNDVIITTQICPNAPTTPHKPVDFMGSPIDMSTTNKYEVLPEMKAVISIDTTKGNRILNHKGFAVSPTVKEGYILRVSDDLVRIMEITTGRPAVTFPITTQDITPYGNGIYHVNSILQPAVATDSPVVGVAICTESVVPGCATGASHEVDIALAVKFSIEVAKEFGRYSCSFYDEKEFELLVSKYGSMKHLQNK